jgi:branched-chain amino acid transport system ATP-binding protein
MSESLLQVEGLTKAFGALRATDAVDLEVQEGETLAVIGPNGAGKTTLIGQLAGNLRPDAGRIRFAGEDITALSAPRRARKGFARSFQITSVFPEFTALENVAMSVLAASGRTGFWRPAMKDAALLEPARQVLADVGLQDKVDAVAANMSHGEHRQLEVAMALATRPRMLLLDEPMAGMGIDESQRMIGLLGTLKRRQTMILVEHDMDAVFRLADRIAVLVYGRVIATGLPEDIKLNPDVRKAYLGEGA